MPRPSPLIPIFGTRCRTEGFALKKAEPGTATYTHFEAFRDRANADSWTVRRYSASDNTRSGKSYIATETLSQNLTFEQAIAMLARYESGHHQNPDIYAVVFPNAAAMQFHHFQAFAEREGYVFDTDGKMHARPGPGLVPSGATFEQAAIARADAHLQRPESEFVDSGLSRRFPDTLFIFDAFNRRAIGKQQGNELAGMRVLNLMDTFVGRIETMNQALGAYAHHHLGPQAPLYLSNAENALLQARSQLRQMYAYGVDVTAFEKMADECAIVINVMHAQGLYDQLRRSPDNYDALEESFKRRATQARELYAALVKKLPQMPNKEEGATALQEMIIQGGAPVLPSAIGEFVERYRTERKTMIAAAAKPAAPPPAL